MTPLCGLSTLRAGLRWVTADAALRGVDGVLLYPPAKRHRMGALRLTLSASFFCQFGRFGIAPAGYPCQNSYLCDAFHSSWACDRLAPGFSTFAPQFDNYLTPVGASSISCRECK